MGERQSIVIFFYIVDQVACEYQSKCWSNHVGANTDRRQVGVEQLFNQFMRPKLRTFIPELYKDISYLLNEDAFSAAEYHDLVRKRFIKAWESLVEGYKVSAAYV